MNQALIDNWNAEVPEDGIVFHLGDFSFGNADEWREVREQLNGKIYLIRGNHDKLQFGQIKDLFAGVYDYLELNVADSDARQGWQFIILCHYSMKVWNRSHHGSWNLYGHSHGSLPDDPNLLSFDVGVDCHNYTPISYEKAKETLTHKLFVPIDHHGSDRNGQ